MGKFGAIRTVRQEHSGQGTEIDLAATSTGPQPTPISVRGRPAGKRSNPDFEPTTIFLRKTTKKIANRTLEDSEVKQDLSELIEQLLQQWISARS
jgi:hypothetical protein